MTVTTTTTTTTITTDRQTDRQTSPTEEAPHVILSLEAQMKIISKI